MEDLNRCTQHSSEKMFENFTQNELKPHILWKK